MGRDVTIKIIRAAATVSLAPYTQEITTAKLGGKIPRGAIGLMCNGLGAGTAAADVQLGIGTVSANVPHGGRLSTVRSQNGATASSRISLGDEAGEDQHVLGLQLSASNAIDGEARPDSWIVNGLRVQWTDAPAAAYLCHLILFAGEDCQTYARDITGHATVDNEQAVSEIDFAPTALFLHTCLNAFNNNSTNGDISFGWGNSDLDQCCIMHEFLASAASANRQGLWDTRILGEGGDQYHQELTAMNSDGFGLTSRTAGAGGDEFGYLALGLGQLSAFCDIVDTPTSTGDNSWTVGFTPQFAMMVFSKRTTANANGDFGATEEIMGIVISDGDDTYSISYVNEDGGQGGNCFTQCVHDDDLEVYEPDGAGGVQAYYSGTVSFGTTSVDVNFSAVSGTAEKVMLFAIEKGGTSVGSRVNGGLAG